jgi:energy-coupling factor transport system substrate-specific component
LEKQSRISEGKNKSYYFKTDELVIIALFAALGGISSTFIGNIARAIFLPLGIPGSGQIASGLHIIWFVLIYLMVHKKFGAVLLSGFIKGFIELFTGNSIGIMAILVAVGAGFTFEVTIYLYTRVVQAKSYHHVGIALAAGLASLSNIVIQLETFIGRNLPPEIFVLIMIFSFLSGVFLAGYLGIVIFKVFERSQILDWRTNS